VNQDRFFPAASSSIAPEGANCGDTAAGIFESCSKYDVWTTLHVAADRIRKDFSIFGSTDVQLNDIGQGELGTCYFLAAIASISYTRPQIIRDMFKRQEQWENNIYTTEWLISGKVAWVEVDDMIPGRNGQPFFVKPGVDSALWPIILEKTWAKIYTSFKAAEGGNWGEAAAAITMAPIRRFQHQAGHATKDQAWEGLLDGTRRKQPMGAGTRANARRYGLAPHHAYAVLEAYDKSGYGRTVKMYNPWRWDGYHGKIPNPTRTDGIFEMTLDEYYDAFTGTEICGIKDGYVTSDLEINAGEEKTVVQGLALSVSSDSDFRVSVTWPGRRLVEPCEKIDPKVSLAIMKEGGGSPHMTSRESWSPPVMGTNVDEGAGEYKVVANGDFPPENVIHRFTVDVYADRKVTIQKLENGVSPEMTFLAMVAPVDGAGMPCETVTFGSNGMFTLDREKIVSGVPTYWSRGAQQFAYFEESSSRWHIVGKSRWENVVQGEHWVSAKIALTELSCGCKDDPNGISMLSMTCAEVNNPQKYGNVGCGDEQYAYLAHTYCPVTCGIAECTARTLQDGDLKKALRASPRGLVTGDAAGYQEVCKDHTDPYLKINGKEVNSCSELTDYCVEFLEVEERCCDTCLQAEIDNGVSTDDMKCEDVPGNKIVDEQGGRPDQPGEETEPTLELLPPSVRNCEAAAKAGMCSEYFFMSKKCCATCKKLEEPKIKEVCEDEIVPSIRNKTTGTTANCTDLVNSCADMAVRLSCCKTCKAQGKAAGAISFVDS